MQSVSQSEQMALQKGSLAVAILSQVPRDDEHNKPLFAEARNLLLAIIKKGLDLVVQPLEDDYDEEEMS